MPYVWRHPRVPRVRARVVHATGGGRAAHPVGAGGGSGPSRQQRAGHGLRDLAQMPSDGERQPVWREYFMYTANFTGSAALAAGTANGAPNVQAFSDFIVSIQSDADFEFLKSMYVATDPRAYARYRDDGSGRQLHRSTLDLRSVAGQVFIPTVPSNMEGAWFLPFIWPTPYVIAAGSSFAVSGADFSGATNTVRITFHGNKIRPGRPPWQVDENGDPRQYRTRVAFALTLPPDGTSFSIAANATALFIGPIDLETDVLIKKISVQRTGAATIKMQDGSGRDRLWQDVAVHVDNFAGNGQFPNNLPSPRWVSRGNPITAEVADLSAATNRVRITLYGEKLYE